MSVSIPEARNPGLGGTSRDWREIPLWILVGIGVGVLSWAVAHLETRWSVAALAAALFVATIHFVRDLRRFFLVTYCLSLQTDLCLRFFFQDKSSYVGSSGPTSIEVPMCALLATALIATVGLGWRRAQRVKLVWPSRFTLPVVALVAAAAVSLINSPERFITLCYIVRILVLSLCLFATANALRSEEDVMLVVNVLMLSLVIQAIAYAVEAAVGATFSLTGDVFVKEYAGISRNGGTVAGAPNALASFLLPLLLIGIARLGSRAEPNARRAISLMVMMGTATLIATFTRAAWIGLALGLVYIVAAGYRRGLVDRRSLAATARALLIPLLALLGLIATRLAADYAADYAERAALMQMAINVFKAHPIIGSGAGAYAWVFRNFLTADLESNWLYIVHNRYLLIAAEMGVVGLAAFILFLAAALRQSRAAERVRSKRMSAVALGCTAGLIGLAWNMFWDVFTGLPVDTLLWTLIGLLCAIERIGRLEGAATRTAAPV